VLFCSLVDIPIARLADRLNRRNIVGTVGFHLGPIFAIAQSGRETQDAGAGLGGRASDRDMFLAGRLVRSRSACSTTERVRSLFAAAGRDRNHSRCAPVPLGRCHLRGHRAGDLIWRPMFRTTIDIITIFLPDHARDARFRPIAEPANEAA
jgi:hypothetical protein